MAYSWDIKVAAIRAYAHIRSLRKVSRIFSVAISTLSRWHRQLLENRLQVRTTRTSKISDALVAFIRQILDQHPFLTRIALKRNGRRLFCQRDLGMSCERRWGSSRRLFCQRALRMLCEQQWPCERLGIKGASVCRISFSRHIVVNQKC